MLLSLIFCLKLVSQQSGHFGHRSDVASKSYWSIALRYPIVILSIVSGLIPFTVGLYTFRSLSNEMKILVPYFGLALVAEVTLVYIAANHVNNLWLFHIFTIVEYGFFVWVFSTWQNPTLRTILRASIPLFSAWGLVAMFLLKNLQQFNALGRSVASLVLVAVSSLTLFELSKERFGSVFRESRFWVACATLVYFAGTLVLFALSNVFVLGWNAERARMVFSINIILSIIANLIFAGGFLCQFQAQRLRGPSSLGPSPS